LRALPDALGVARAHVAGAATDGNPQGLAALMDGFIGAL
jgi:hypothetical protein